MRCIFVRYEKIHFYYMGVLFSGIAADGPRETPKKFNPINFRRR